MKIRIWPFIAFGLALWWQTIIALIYVLIGLSMKIGPLQIKSQIESKDRIVIPSASELIVDFYHILTWPWYVKSFGYKEVGKLILVGFLFSSLSFGIIFYVGTNAPLTEKVTERYRAMMVKYEGAFSVSVREEMHRRFENGLTYADSVWIKNNVLKACGGKLAPVNEDVSYITGAMMAMLIGLTH